jgi:hypothetical protein
MQPIPPEDDDDLGMGTARSASSGLRPIRVGARVTSTNPAPVFASDPQVGDRGTVQQTSGDEASASYLVRWDGGSESWSKREHLKPSGRGSLLPAPGETPAGPASAPPQTGPTPDGPQPTRPARPPMGTGARSFQRFLPLVFILFAGQGLIRALVRSAHHPSADTALLALVVVAVLGLAVSRIVRRGGGSSRNRRPRGPGGGA